MDFSELIPELHPTKNGKWTARQIEIRPKSKWWWLCAEGHEWQATPSKRMSKSEGCLICSGEIVVLGFNDLRTTHPLLFSQWDFNKNKIAGTKITSKTLFRTWWLCNEGHSWQDSPLNRALDENSWSACINHTEPINVSLVYEWHTSKNFPIEFSPSLSLHRRYWWVGQCGHEWKSTILNRSLGSKCPICANRQLLVGLNDLSTVNEILASEWHPFKNGNLKPERITASSGSKVWWLGKCGHEWVASVNSRNRGAKCSICTNRTLLVGFNDLATLNPNVAAEWHPKKNGELTPDKIIATSSTKYWWICSLRHEWQATSSNRLKLSSGCPVCSNKIIVVGFNDFATLHPDLVPEWHTTRNANLTPEQVTTSTAKKIWWRCSQKGHVWQSWVYSRTNGNGCPQCSTTVSKAEQEIYDYVRSLDGKMEMIQSDRNLLKGKELDIYLPEKRIAIEFNGIYWHNEKQKGRDFHHDKWEAAKRAGIQLIQIWEDDWMQKPDLVKRLLARKIDVFKELQVLASKTEVITVTKQQAEKFLNENHIQGYTSGSYYIGLAKTCDIEKLQAVMVLDIEPNSDSRSLEIITYASSANISDDFGRLLSHAFNAYSPESITVIADHCEADEELYENNGFIAEKELPPDYMYVVRNERKDRSEYPLERFHNDPKLLWEEGLTAMELADLNGLSRIWDAGKTRYKLSL